jgi:tetratricopeptide (TPR) repeat protein
MPTTAERMKEALAHHQAGRLAQAEAIYRAVLQEEPRQPHALRLLGVIAHQAGRNPDALDLIGRALAAGGAHPVFHSNLSAVYLALRRFDDAAAHAGEALRLNPAFADAHNNRRRGLDLLDTARKVAPALNVPISECLAQLIAGDFLAPGTY